MVREVVDCGIRQSAVVRPARGTVAAWDTYVSNSIVTHAYSLSWMVRNNNAIGSLVASGRKRAPSCPHNLCCLYCTPKHRGARPLEHGVSRSSNTAFRGPRFLPRWRSLGIGTHKLDSVEAIEEEHYNITSPPHNSPTTNSRLLPFSS
jgi:hypothetical protein